MPILGPRIPFHNTNISQVTAPAGVYALWAGEEIIFYGWSGASPGLRARLQAHKNGACTKEASAFQVQRLTGPTEPQTRRDQLLREFLRDHGELPRCNTPGDIPLGARVTP